jgi:hypothetical protein
MITWRADDVQARLARHERLATAIVADYGIRARRAPRPAHAGLVSLLQATGTRLPVAELRRYRSRTVG